MDNPKNPERSKSSLSRRIMPAALVILSIIAIFAVMVSISYAGKVRSLEGELREIHHQQDQDQRDRAREDRIERHMRCQPKSVVTYNLYRDADGFISEHNASDHDSTTVPWMSVTHIRGAEKEVMPYTIEVDGEKQAVYATVPQNISQVVDFYNRTHQAEKVAPNQKFYRGNDAPTTKYPEDLTGKWSDATFDHLMDLSITAIDLGDTNVDFSGSSMTKNERIVTMLNAKYGGNGVEFMSESWKKNASDDDKPEPKDPQKVAEATRPEGC